MQTGLGLNAGLGGGRPYVGHDPWVLSLVLTCGFGPFGHLEQVKANVFLLSLPALRAPSPEPKRKPTLLHRNQPKQRTTSRLHLGSSNQHSTCSP